MKVIKVKDKDQSLFIISLTEGDKCVRFLFGGNGDLYWSFNARIDDKIDDKTYEKIAMSGDKYFIITKENYAVYSLFEQLFLDIENISFAEEEMPVYFESEEQEREYLKEREKEIEYQKRKYREFNCSNYNELYDDESKTITWYSDETAHEVANILKIKKNEDSFRIEFYIQPYVDGYDRELNYRNCVSIRFRNSGSRYKPFNISFMKMFNAMQEIDDVNDIGHQMHIEEYLYDNEMVKKLTNTK